MLRLRFAALAPLLTPFALVLALATTERAAHAEPSAPKPKPVAPQTVRAAAEALAPTPGTAAVVGHLIVVLDVLGIVEKNAPAAPSVAGRSFARSPSWLSPEPPKTPLLYSSLVVAKF
jgi:hypothetical protein